MTYFLACLAGVAVGIVATVVFQHIRKSHGILKIDQTNPEKDVYRFEIDDLSILAKRKRITLKVDTNADLSQK